MRSRPVRAVVVGLLALVAVLSSCDRGGTEVAAGDPPEVSGKGVAAVELERISVAEIGKLRSKIGEEVIVFGAVGGTSTSRSGHHFLNFPNGFKIVCFRDQVPNFPAGGPAELFAGRVVEVQGELTSHEGKPQILLESPDQIEIIKDGRGGTPATDGRFELVEVGPGTWVSPAGLRYTGRDAKGLTRREHVLRHAKDQPGRAGSHGVFDADGDAVFAVVDEAWGKIEARAIRPRVEGNSQTYLVPMGRRVGYLGGQAGARRGKPELKSVFIVLRRGTKEVITAFPR